LKEKQGGPNDDEMIMNWLGGPSDICGVRSNEGNDCSGRGMMGYDDYSELRFSYALRSFWEGGTKGSPSTMILDARDSTVA